ncbi:MAG: SCO1664 family protein [Acidimicrobiia bacterium]|nr:SCO1664 family protein [Acidimicrobiia bacterium]
MSSTELTSEDLNKIVAGGEIELIGKMPWSSNATFLAEATLGEHSARVIYKPHIGERPLWDFPDGLWKREVAAYELSDALGWNVVPFTIARNDAPHGTGSVQRFIDADFEQHYFTMLEDEATHDQLQRMAAFDFVCNNTDRKGGHCLIDSDGHIWGIDNGLSFHAEFKLRTVIWDFGGEEIDENLLRDLQEMIDAGLPRSVAELLGTFEQDAILGRARALVREGVLPIDESGHRYPWPLI